MRIAPVLVRSPCPLPILLRAVRAGFPSPADDHLDRGIDLNDILIRNRAATFLVRVDGDSMREKGLRDGDLAVVDRSVEPRNGDVVVVVVDVDGERSFKVWAARSGSVMLSFANPSFPEYPMPAGADVEIWGVVTGSVNPRRRAG